MRYVSDKTNRVYDTIAELEEAEGKFDAELKAKELKKAQKEERQKEVREAYNHYNKLAQAYYNDYGDTISPLNIFDMFW